MASAHCLRQLQRPWRLVQRACSPASLPHQTRGLAAMASSKPIVRGIVFDMVGDHQVDLMSTFPPHAFRTRPHHSCM
jgi:hypothetical protein